MDHFCWTGRFSVKETSICVVDDAGKIVRESKGWRANLKRCWRC